MDAETRKVIEEAVRRLRGAGVDEAAREGYRLLGLALALSPEQIWRDPPSLAADSEGHRRFWNLVERRAAGEPFAYLSRQQEFFGLPLWTPRGVLIPRPETELLVEVVLQQYGAEARVAVDVGTGTGAIALALQNCRPTWQVVASDVSCWALFVAAVNRDHLGLPVHLVRADLLTGSLAHAIGSGPAGQIFWPGPPADLICANLPYIDPEDVQGMNRETAAEPRLALFAADGGLALMRNLVDQAPRRLRTGGGLFLEVGRGQHMAVVAMMRRRGFVEVSWARDLSGIERVVYGWWKGGGG